MDRLIRECQSIVELNRIIDRGLDDKTYQLAMDRLFELVLEGERNAEMGAPSNDAGTVVSPENRSEMDDSAATTSAGATSLVDVIYSMDDIDGLNRIIDEDNWTTEASGLAFQRILELAGVEDFDEMIRNWSTAVNEEMQSDNMVGGDNPIDLDQNVQTPSGGELKRTADEPVDELRDSIPEGAISDNGGEELRGDGENDDVSRGSGQAGRHLFLLRIRIHEKQTREKVYCHGSRLSCEIEKLGRQVRPRRPVVTLRHHGRCVGPVSGTVFNLVIW